jgi:Legionella pneumophila major outer membrane protein precursor
MSITTQTKTSLQYRTHKRAQTKGNLDLALGLRWDRNFLSDRFHISFNAGFEQHIYFNMAQNFFTSSAYQTQSGASGRDFALSGFAFGGRFDY